MDITSAGAVVGAVAALVAATLSALNLHLSGRRETRSWLRQTALDAFTQFLDASFLQPSRITFEEVLTGRAPGDRATYKRRVAAAHASQNSSLTKLRLLAPDGVVRAAERLHLADMALATAVLEVDGALPPEHWSVVREEQNTARDLLIAEARLSLGLPGSTHRLFSRTN